MENTVTPRERWSPVAWLEADPPSRFVGPALLLTALALIWFYLSSYLTMVMPVGKNFSFPPAPGFKLLPLLILLVCNGLLALGIGLLAGRGVPRLKWLVGPALLILIGLLMTLVTLHAKGAWYDDAAGKMQTFHYQLDLSWEPLLRLATGVLGALVGGLLSPALFRRMRLSIAVGIAWAWLAVSLLSYLFFFIDFAHFQNVVYTGGSLTDLYMRTNRQIPYFMGGIGLGWALWGRRPWVGWLGLAALVLLQLMGVWFAHNAVWSYISWALTGLMAGAIGVWLGILVAGARSRRELLRPALVILVGLAMALVAGSLARNQEAIKYSGNEGEGVSSAVESPVKNGEAILLTKEGTVGALILTRQGLEPERVSYDWYYRTDGRGTFAPGEAEQYRHGQVKDATSINFGPFALAWSGHDETSGYLYYRASPGMKVTAQTPLICVTHEQDLKDLDAFDPRWIYKGSPSDPGTPLPRQTPSVNNK